MAEFTAVPSDDGATLIRGGGEQWWVSGDAASLLERLNEGARMTDAVRRAHREASSIASDSLPVMTARIVRRILADALGLKQGI